MEKETNIMQRVYEPRRLLEAWQRVKKNDEAAGIDQMSVADFERGRQDPKSDLSCLRNSQLIEEMNEYLRVWVSYYRIQESKYLPKKLDTWTRCRLR